MSGLYSPLLAQAGFAKRKLASVIGNAIEWVAEIDGVMQYWVLTESIAVHAGYVVKFEVFNTGKNESGYLLCNDTSTSLSVFTNYDGEVSHAASTDIVIDIDGMGGDVEVKIHDSQIHQITLTFLESGSFKKLASRYNEARLLKGYIANLVVYNAEGVLVNKIPLTNKTQGANQLATVGNVNAFMPNYTNAVWKNKAELV